MDREVLVYADLQGTPYLVGRLWSRTRKDRESATFEYDKIWLAHPERFSLEPALKLGPGPFHAAFDKPLFGAIGDSAPDRWGRSSLGGARPKASVRDRDGHLAIAKFPNKGDEFNTVLWEAVALTLAAKAGIPVPTWRLATVADKPVLLLRRFDRQQGARIPFVSAMSMLDARDNEARSYLEFVDVLRQHGAAPKQDMHALWRRIVFNILISNTDDHLRNHGFLWAGPAGWRLSPAYDLNPVPTDIKPRVLSTAIDLDDGRASLKLAVEVSGYFELTAGEAGQIAGEVGKAVSAWRKVAAKLGLTAGETDRMASAFEHEDIKAALPQPKLGKAIKK